MRIGLRGHLTCLALFGAVTTFDCAAAIGYPSGNASAVPPVAAQFGDAHSTVRLAQFNPCPNNVCPPDPPPAPATPP